MTTSLRGKWLVLFALIAFAFGLGCGRDSAMVGSWKCGWTPLSLYPDGVASYGGQKGTWESIANGTARIEFNFGGEDPILMSEFRLQGEKDGRKKGSLDYAGVTFDCVEGDEG